MGMFGFRRLREREAAAKAAAFLSSDEPKITTEPKPKRRRTVKPKPEKPDGDHN